MVSFTGPFKLPEAYHERRKLRVFTLKEINRIKIIQDVIERRITTRRAAKLGISDEPYANFLR